MPDDVDRFAKEKERLEERVTTLAKGDKPSTRVGKLAGNTQDQP